MPILLFAYLFFPLAHSTVQELDQQSFSSLIHNEVSLVLFYAPWCPHCKRFLPVFHQASNELSNISIAWGQLNCDKFQALGGKYAQAYPTLYLFQFACMDLFLILCLYFLGKDSKLNLKATDPSHHFSNGFHRKFSPTALSSLNVLMQI